MGARESRSQREADEDGDGGIGASQDYYAILEVDEDASADEIRVSFPSFPVPRPPRCPGCPDPCVCLRCGPVALRFLRLVMLIEIFFGPVGVTAFVPTSRAHTSSRQESE
jgi:hypothetical protein